MEKGPSVVTVSLALMASVRVSVQGEHPDRSNVNTQIGAR